MRVLVTGAGGNLGRAVLPVLAALDHDVATLDLRPEHGGGDVRRAADVARAVTGVDAVVHAAALHGVHLSRFDERAFWETNVTGTFNVYAARPPRVVLCSTMGVYGHAIEQPAAITEETPVAPADVYGLSKYLCEELARCHARTDGISTVALRLGMFVPETFERYGFRPLFGGVDDRDVAQAVALALAHEPAGGFDCFDVMAPTPFSRADAARLATDPEALVERYWPGTRALAAEIGLDVRELVWGATVWPIEKARRVLGFEPRHGFGEFVDALRRGDRAYYASSGESQWGV